MGALNINDIKVGMVLAQDVRNKHGIILLKEGRILAERDITVLKTWGITEVSIKDVDRDQVVKEEMEALPNDVVESIEKELDELFPPLGDNPVMEEIYRIVKKFRFKEALEQTHGSGNKII
ncbi:MAG: hypothetical protein IMF10_00025 [Proteobacteria bacterium]|nr:hypothetical protein [Pseudomonadota bacterium]